VHIANALKAPTPFCLMHLYPIDAPFARRQGCYAVERARRVILDGDRRHQPRSKDAEALKTWGRAYWEAIHPFNLKAPTSTSWTPMRPRTGSS
jgi:hypothetical protein